MEYALEEYIYDSERMILYRNSLEQEKIDLLRELYKTNIYYDEIYDRWLSSLDSLSYKNHLNTQFGICLTYNCQLRCTYCGYSSQENNTTSLTLTDIEAFTIHIIKNIKIKKMLYNIQDKLKVFFTGGGEPTYDWLVFKSVIEMIEHKCIENNIEYSFDLTTNGLLSNDKIKYIAGHFDSVMVSFDGTPNVHDNNRINTRNSNGHKIVVNTISKLTQCTKKPYVTVRTTIWQYDFNKMTEMADYIHSFFRNVDEWSLLPIIPVGRAEARIKTSADKLETYDYFKSYMALKNYISENKLDIQLSTPMFPLHLCEIFCGSLFVKCPWLMPDGSIVTCIESKNMKTIVGNISDAVVNIKNSYSDKIMQKYREKYIGCKNCFAFRLCKGGCPLKEINSNSPSSKINEWECSMIKEYWEYILNNIVRSNECLGWKAKNISHSKLSYGDAFLIQNKES